jgi:flagellar biosynthetic protein FliR
MESIEQILPYWAYASLLIFCRVGAAVMVMPVLSDASVPAQVRLAVAVGVTAAIYPVVPGLPPAGPPMPVELLRQVLVETCVGIVIGMGARILLASLHLAGAVSGQIFGLTNPMGAVPAGFEGASTLSSILLVAGSWAILASDAHHMMIRGVVDSYSLLPFGAAPPAADAALALAQVVGEAFRIAVMVSTPAIVLAIVFKVGLGLANRIMPLMPVYFVATPVLIVVGVAITALTLPSILVVFLDAVREWVFRFR